MLDVPDGLAVTFGVEVRPVSEADRVRALTEAGLLHPSPDAVGAALFIGPGEFFLPVDKVQVKYEMLRAHAVDGMSVTAAAAAHGYSRAAFYLVSAAFERAGMIGLLDERPGRRGPLKITPEIVAFIVQAPSNASGADLSGQIAERFGVVLHRRTVERIRR
jgi:transposase